MLRGAVTSLLALLLLTSHHQPVRAHLLRACDGTDFRATCRPGHVLVFRSGFYGRTDRQHCGGGVRVDCVLSSAIFIVTDFCFGKSSCELPVPGNTFPDPCPREKKYLEANIDCVPRRQITPICQTYFAKEGSGYITSPNYPRPYDKLLKCELEVQVPAGEQVEVTILDLEVEARNSQGCYDWLTVLERDDHTQRYDYCGTMFTNTEKTRLVLKHPVVRFKTDGMHNYRGFLLEYRTLSNTEQQHGQQMRGQRQQQQFPQQQQQQAIQQSLQQQPQMQQGPLQQNAQQQRQPHERQQQFQQQPRFPQHDTQQRAMFQKNQQENRRLSAQQAPSADELWGRHDDRKRNQDRDPADTSNAKRGETPRREPDYHYVSRQRGWRPRSPEEDQRWNRQYMMNQQGRQNIPRRQEPQYDNFDGNKRQYRFDQGQQQGDYQYGRGDRYDQRRLPQNNWKQEQYYNRQPEQNAGMDRRQKLPETPAPTKALTTATTTKAPTTTTTTKATSTTTKKTTTTRTTTTTTRKTTPTTTKTTSTTTKTTTTTVDPKKPCQRNDVILPENAYVKSYRLERLAVYACLKGYRLSERSLGVMLCHRGQWVGDPGRCVAEHCQPLPQLHHGTIVKKSDTPGSVALYRCHHGYRLLGPVTRSCLDSGRWSGLAGRCEGRGGQPPSAVEDDEPLSAVILRQVALAVFATVVALYARRRLTVLLRGLRALITLTDRLIESLQPPAAQPVQPQEQVQHL